MTTLDLAAVLPGTEEATRAGCTCPHGRIRLDPWPVVLVVGDRAYDPRCPLHRAGVLAEAQRMFGMGH